MQFNIISTEEDVRENRIRAEVVWSKEDVDRYTDFFGIPLADVLGVISEPDEQVGTDAPAGRTEGSNDDDR